MNRTIAVCVLVLGVLTTPTSVIADEHPQKKHRSPLKIDLDMYHSDTEEEITARIDITYQSDDFLETAERFAALGSHYFHGQLNGRLVHSWDADLNNEPSFLEARYGWLWNVSGVEKLTELPPIPTEEEAFEAPPTPQLAFDYGKIGIVGNLVAETDDGADNTSIAAGIVATYSAITAFPDWKVPLPSLLMAMEYVLPQSADAREAIGVGDSAFTRFRGAVLWSWDFGARLDLKNRLAHQLGVLLHYQYVQQFDQKQAWTDEGYDAYQLAAIRLRYHFEPEMMTRWGLRNLFVGYSSGRQIDYTDDDRRIVLGITVQ